MSHGWPPKCTGTIALVRGAALARRVRDAEVERVGLAVDQDAACAPTWMTVAAVEAKVSVGTSTSSPRPTPRASSPRCRPAVAELTATACGAPTARGERLLERARLRPHRQPARAQRIDDRVDLLLIDARPMERQKLALLSLAHSHLIRLVASIARLPDCRRR